MTLLTWSKLPRDSIQTPIMSANWFVTQDATWTPKTSPLVYSSSEIAITVPTNAVEFVLMPTTDLRVSEITWMARYDLVKANSKEVIWVAWISTVYIKRDWSDWSLYFRFITV